MESLPPLRVTPLTQELFAQNFGQIDVFSLLHALT
jgi:hypothetical protein